MKLGVGVQLQKLLSSLLGSPVPQNRRVSHLDAPAIHTRLWQKIMFSHKWLIVRKRFKSVYEARGGSIAPKTYIQHFGAPCAPKPSSQPFRRTCNPNQAMAKYHFFYINDLQYKNVISPFMKLGAGVQLQKLLSSLLGSPVSQNRRVSHLDAPAIQTRLWQNIIFFT